MAARGTVRNRLLVPGVLTVMVTVGSLFALGGGAGAAVRAAERPARAAAVYPCHGYSTYHLTTTPNAGAPNSSYFVCVHGRLVRYGNSAIVYTTPTAGMSAAAAAAFIAHGDLLFQEYCSSCHTPDAGGGTRAPNLRGVGPATVEFWIDTGRMPATIQNQVQAPIKPPKLTKLQARQVAAWVNSLDPATPYVPSVNVKAADLSDGASLFALNCAACHTITGAGDALAKSTFAPTLHLATPAEVAEAIRTGPGNMPRFSGNLNDWQVRDLVAYVTEKIQKPANIGGNGLGGIGPVTEGFVGLLFGVGGLALVCFWIGDRAK